jgi:hypothetical protein
VLPQLKSPPVGGTKADSSTKAWKKKYYLSSGVTNSPAMHIQKEEQYIIPSRFRRMENMHIVFWLMKDISWCMIWRELGLAMFIPTLSIAIMIAWRTRHIKAELAHNLAIAFWITANGYWMTSEFFGFDENPVWSWVTGKHMALIPFVTGAFILLYYYTIQRPKEIKKKHMATM